MPFVEQQPNQFAYNSQEWSSLDPEARYNLEADDLRELAQFLGNNFENLTNNVPSPEQTEDSYNKFHGKNLAVEQSKHPVASAEFSEDGQANSEYVDSLAAESVHEQAVNYEVSIENRPISTAEVATNSLIAQIGAYGEGIDKLRNGVTEQNRKR
ncbi:hypothetical protein HG444_000820 [Candidatus Saccharibacteria bacterium]|nr:hypothetical protein [Candidatus Saccharibacteria bacterium]